MVKKWFSILISILLILSPLCFSSFLVSATPAIGSTTVTLHSIADAYVNASSPDTNYGSSDSLYVSANSKLDYTYVMFDLSSLPSEANIIYARLRLYLSDTGGTIYGLPSDDVGAYYCSDNSWTENGITWTNRPNFNSEPTDVWSFSLGLIFANYRSWDVTADVKQAFSSGILTEVVKFESKTGEGYLVFDSKEDGAEPLLEIEYSIEPVAVVNLESSQDRGVTSNLGIITFADESFSLQSDVDVVTGTYQVSYSGGYLFTHWETVGGVSVSNPLAATTTVTVTGDGTLRAVGTANLLEYTYDYGYSSYGTSETEGCIDSVRFTPLFSGQLLMARFYMDYVSSSTDHTVKVHVMDENRNDVITPFEQTPDDEGWFDVSLSAYDIDVTEGTDFYVGLEWLTDYSPRLGVYSQDLSGRSWQWNGTIWEEVEYKDFMIRAIVGEKGLTIEPTIVDHIVVADGTDFHVVTESNSTISNCQFNKDGKELLFDVARTVSSYGFCNVTIPNRLLGGPFGVKCDGQTVSDVLSSGNSTHTCLRFIYAQTTSSIEITGTTVIPEFSSAIILTLFVSLALIAVALIKKNVVR
jgi:hypothetical protein